MPISGSPCEPAPGRRATTPPAPAPARLGFRRELSDARKRLVRRNRIVLVSALAAAGIAGVAIWTGGLHGTRTPTTIAAVVRVDLRPFALVRNEVQDPPKRTSPAGDLTRLHPI